jgi:glycosyltransferase involved in cell wall biosynthesis
VRTYIEAKRAALLETTDWRHVLVIPGHEDGVEVNGRLTTYRVAGRPVPNTAGYRFMTRMDKVRAILDLESPDVIELGSPYLLPWPAFRYRASRPCAVVGFYHTDFPEAYAGVFVGRALGKRAGRASQAVAERYARVVYQRCDLTVASSEAFRARLSEMGIRETRTIYLGVDLDTFHPVHRDEGLREGLGLIPGDVLLTYAGRLDGEKCVDVLVECMGRLHPEVPAHLLLIGEGPYRRRLEESTRDNPRITIKGYLSDRAGLARHLASSDIYVTAGPHETFGLSVVEAQASGLPVAGVRAGALIDRVPEAVSLLGAPGSAEELARNVERIWRSLASMSGKAREHVVENYSWSRTFREIFGAYRELHGAAVERDRAAREGTPLRREPAQDPGRHARKLVHGLQRCGHLLGIR